MQTRLSGLAVLWLVALLAVACGAESTPAAAPPPTATVELAAGTATNPPATATTAPTDTPAPAAVETPASPPAAPPDTPLPAPREAPAPTDTPAVVATFGLTEDGLYFRGNPDAAVTVIDYSDFL
jgi:hypothetical protein